MGVKAQDMKAGAFKRCLVDSEPCFFVESCDSKAYPCMLSRVSQECASSEENRRDKIRTQLGTIRKLNYTRYRSGVIGLGILFDS